MKYTLLSILLSLSISGTVKANEQVDPELLNAAEQYLVLTEAQWGFEESIKQSKNMLGQLKSPKPEGMSEEYIELLEKHEKQTKAVLDEFLSWQTVEPLITKMIVSTYSLEDLNAINAFYATDAGRTMISKTPELAKSQMKMMQDMMGQMMARMDKLNKQHQQERNELLSN